MTVSKEPRKYLFLPIVLLPIIRVVSWNALLVRRVAWPQVSELSWSLLDRNLVRGKQQVLRCAQDDHSLMDPFVLYFSRTTTNSGAHSNARLNSESGKMQMA